MKLYYSPGACSQAPHIALYETGLPFEAVRVDLATKRLPGGADYLAIASKGAVPALELDDGSILTESAAVLHYIADQAPATHLMPPVGTMPYYRELEWLNWLASELHKSFAPLFHPSGEPGARATALATVEANLAYADAQLGAGPWLLGDTFTVADTYLFAILGWTRPFHLDLARWPSLKAFRERAREKPAVHAALHAEGFAR